jgi:hypothetical protein
MYHELSVAEPNGWELLPMYYRRVPFDILPQFCHCHNIPYPTHTMAEAVALAMSTFALLDRLTVLTTRLGCSMHDAPGDILRLRKSLGGVSAVFRTLFGGDDPRQGISGSRLECLREPLHGLNRDLEELTSGIEILEVKRSKRIRWALGEEAKFAKAVQRLEAYKTLFALAIAADER